MLRLSYFYKYNELWSAVCGSVGCDANNEWSLGGPDKEWSVKVTDIYWRSLCLTLDIPKNIIYLTKG